MIFEETSHSGTQKHTDQENTITTTPESVVLPHKENPSGTVNFEQKVQRGRVFVILRFVAAVLVLFVLGTGGWLTYVIYSFQNRVYPNISVRGVSLAQLTSEEAKQFLETHYAPFFNQPVTLTYRNLVWTPRLEELGVHIELHAAIQEALHIGRTQNWINDLQTIAAIWINGFDIPLRMTIDQDLLRRYLMQIAQAVDHPPQEATLTFDGTQTHILADISGRQTNIDTTMRDLIAALHTMQPQSVAIRTEPLLPIINVDNALEARRTIDTILSSPLKLHRGNKSWEWTIEDLSKMIQISRMETTDTQERLLVTLDRKAVQERLDKIVKESLTGMTYPRVDWNGGDLLIYKPGTSGTQIDQALAESIIMQAITTPEHSINLPIKQVPPPVNEENLHSLGIKELIAVGSSDFSGSENYRITNIQAGMRLLHGVLVAPNEEFSFNKTVGEISAKNGFVEGYAIVENRTQLEWGGGICQDSTTLFRAAFWAGLPITERWGHQFHISWYDRYGFGPYGDGPGMDATIFTGGPDLKFINDTGNWILIQTGVDVSQSLAQVFLYGTKVPHRTVELEGPEITNRRPAPTEPVYIADSKRAPGSPFRSDRARGGMDITFTRIVKDGDKELRRGQYVTRFQPWPDIYQINPADLGPNGKPWPTATSTADSRTPLPDVSSTPGSYPYPQHGGISPDSTPQPDSTAQPVFPTIKTPIQPVEPSPDGTPIPEQPQPDVASPQSEQPQSNELPTPEYQPERF